MKDYGQFSADGLEYIVTTPHTPRDWFNFFWNPTYLACAGNSMNGCSLYQNEAGVVTNLFGKQDMREDPRWIYIRDNQTGEVWSAGYLPCHTEHDAYEVRNGLGYTVLRTLKNGIRVAFRVFVPRHHAGELWTVTVTNEGRKRRDLSVFTVSNVMLDGANMPYGYVGGLSAEYLPKDNMLFFRNMTFTVVNEKYRAFMYSDVKIDRWDVAKDYFLGRTRNYACPQRVVDGKLGNSIGAAEYLVGAVQQNMSLAAGKSRTTNFVLGIVLDEREARRMIRAFADGRKIERELAAVKQANIRRLGGLTLATPDDAFNRLFSVWLKHELYLMADWARFYFKGYRDTCQDAAGMSVINPERALEMLRKALRNQRSDGFAPRAFRVASMDIAAADKHYCDSPSWISHATDALLTETGDLSMLDQVVSYSDKGRGSIWEHNVRAMEFLWQDRGANGLSLIHYGDWCDLIDKAGVKGKGVSIWMSFALARVLTLVGWMAEARGEHRLAATCRQRYAKLARSIRRHGWDGDHFLYAINDDGMRIGSSRSEEGKYFINPQSWALLSGVITPAAYLKITRKYEPRVDTPVGPITCWPPFTHYDAGIGQLTGTPSGFFTNGNVYCHAAGFKIAADYEAGRIDKAFDTFRRILPSPEKSEPYAQVNGYVGPSAMRMQRHVSDDPWRTGTVAWNFLNCVDRLLGFRRTLAGFHLRPLLPSAWKHATFDRPFRGTLFHVEIRRGRKASLKVDGVPVAGDFVAVPAQGLGRKTVHILCTIPQTIKTEDSP
jgi:cellobiose phosphorylase